MPFAGGARCGGGVEEVGASYAWHEVNGQHAFLRDEGPRYDPELFAACMGWALALFGRVLRRGD